MTYFRKKRAIAGGLTIAGSSLGGVIFPLMALHLMPQVGFAWAIRICAFLILFLLVITNMTISSNLQHRRKPFQISNFLRPLLEANYIIMCLASFFLYCTFCFLTLCFGLRTYLIPFLQGACSCHSTTLSRLLCTMA